MFFAHRLCSLYIYLQLSTGLQEVPYAQPTQETAGNDAESEVSDVEERGYCDVSSFDPELQMELKPVRKHKIESMYNNTDLVNNLKHTKHS